MSAWQEGWPGRWMDGWMDGDGQMRELNQNYINF